MKRALCLMAAAVLALSASGCSGGEEPPAVTETAPPVSKTAFETTVISETEPRDVLLDYDSYRVRVEGSVFMAGDSELWINGVNTPWQNWNDFGGNFDADFWDSHFAELHEKGVNASRVWVNCNGMSIVRLRSNGMVKEVKEQHWKDLDTLFDIAEKHGIYIMATFLSFDHFKDGNAGCESYRAMIKDEEATQSYIDGYVIPFVERYGGSPMLWSIDLMNEPDWVHENNECGKMDMEDLCRFFARCSAAIHENSDELVTVGWGMIKYNSDKYDGNYMSDEYLKSMGGENAYLDFYSPHYYFWQNSFLGYPFETTPEDFGADAAKPVVIGEAAVISESGRTPLQDYENAYKNGWNGVMAWTSNGVDACGSLEELSPAVERMKEIIPDLMGPAA